MTILFNSWQRIGILLVLLCVFFVNAVGCKKEMETTEASTVKKNTEKVKFTDTGGLLLTEEEVRSFVEAVPAFKKVLKKEGFNDTDKNIFIAFQSRNTSMINFDSINNALKPYGFDLEGFLSTYGKIKGTYNYMMKLETNKTSRADIKRMKELLEKPYIDEEQKEQMKKLIKETEDEEKTEEAMVYRKNMLIVKKYGDKLKMFFSSF